MIGIGVIEGPYEYHANRNQFWHVRKARWLVSTELQFDESIFRIDTFFRTLKWQKIKDKLLERHPGLREELGVLNSVTPLICSSYEIAPASVRDS